MRLSVGPARDSYRLIRAMCAALILMAAVAAPVSAAPATIVVPTAYPTIQAAIDAAAPGDTIRVLPGTYTEQLHISKDLTIIGAGRHLTTIRAPSVLEVDDLGDASIVLIDEGASVSMSRLTIAGPGSGTCESGALANGIRVRGEAHLDFRHGAVRNIRDAMLAPCFRSGNGIFVGQVPVPASLTVQFSEITGYQSAGIVVLGFGSTATVTHNIVTGPGQAGGVATDGIEFPVGAVGTIASNIVSGNICPPTDPDCGPDWFTQFQHAGIAAGGNGPGTVVKNNFVFGNQVGLFLGESDEISNNLVVGSAFFGYALFNGTISVQGGHVLGGGGGVWLIADEADMTAHFSHVRFAGLSGPKVGKVECCGFTATATFGPQ
jgi:hypothetical protein